ncbi:MAG: tetratricopeptide repeat protein [Myxococcales bacterium]|nr:tetratricopeptide repeat protein [Myxococcales bacterium]
MSPEPTDEQQWQAVEEATELLLEGNHEAALRELHVAIAADPRNGYAFHYVGVALDELERDMPARDAFRAAVRLCPNYLAARIGLSHSLRKLGELRDALREAAEALRRFPDDGEAHHAMGMALAARGDKGRAREHFERYLDQKPEIDAAMEVRAMIEGFDLEDAERKQPGERDS